MGEGEVVRSRCAVEVWGVWVVCVLERGANADVVPMREVMIDRIVNALILMFIFVIVIIAFSLAGAMVSFVCMGDNRKMIGFVLVLGC